MALNSKRVLFKSKILRVNKGVSSTSMKSIVQLVLISAATKERKAINIGAQRADEVATALEGAAYAIRSDLSGGRGEYDD